MGKIICRKLECSVCHKVGLAQFFLNRNEEVKYARTRHYSHIDKDSKKPQFTYCKLENLEALKTLLLNQGIPLSVGKSESGQVGQCQTAKIHDLKLQDSSLNQGGRSLAWLGHQPPTLTTRVQIPATAF
jgi:hypothetical protein